MFPAQCWLAENATLIGDIEIKECVTIWYQVVIRADVNYIRIGAWSNIQDGAVVHVNGTPSHPTIIGSFVSVGHNATIHGCTIEDECLIGMGATVLNGAHIGSRSIIAAGAVVKEGQHIPSGHLAAGVPAKVIRPLSDEEQQKMRRLAEHYWKDISAPYREYKPVAKAPESPELSGD